MFNKNKLKRNTRRIYSPFLFNIAQKSFLKKKVVIYLFYHLVNPFAIFFSSGL